MVATMTETAGTSTISSIILYTISRRLSASDFRFLAADQSADVGVMAGDNQNGQEAGQFHPLPVRQQIGVEGAEGGGGDCRQGGIACESRDREPGDACGETP